MWHARTTGEVVERFQTDKERGLLSEEVKTRLKRDGENVLPNGKHDTWLRFFLKQFRSPLVYILLIAAVLTAWLALFPRGHEPGIEKWVDTIVIMLAVAMNVVVGFYQEFRSNNILESLEKAVRSTALVLRDGDIHEIESRNLVAGDIILLRPGRKVPADARVLESKRLQIKEAALTGESKPVEKETGKLPEKQPLAERTNMVFMGSLVSSGEGRAVVVATGAKTEIGKITLLTTQTKEELTPLQLRMKELGKLISILVGVAALLVFAIGFFSGHSFEQMFTTAIAVAVAAIPEGLPAAISIALAISAQKILRRKGVVKHLIAAETLGSATVVCTDKTGTLTEGKMQVKKIITHDREQALRALALSNEVLVEKEGNVIHLRGEVTDQAKMQKFFDEGGDLGETLLEFPRVAMLPFDSTRNYIASVHEAPQKDVHLLYLSGAPERVLSLSATTGGEGGAHAFGEKEKAKIKEEYERLAGNGYRVIALAKKVITFDVDSRKAKENFLLEKSTREKIVSDLEFLGLVVIRDPVREDVHASIATARRAGIKVVMLTGDHALTARNIGKDLGFGTAPENIITGSELEDLHDEELDLRVGELEIYARVTPEHKMRAIGALKRAGEVVAMTGDGINDAPALKSADIGISVESGTDIAKESSDFILLNNSFSVIVTAIKYGRVAFDNIRKVAVFLLSGSFTELILVLASLVFRLPLPVTAVQILWTNLVEDSLPNVALAFEPGDKDIMKRPPMKKDTPVLNKEAKAIIFIVGIFTDLLILLLYLYLHFYTDLSIQYIQTFIFATLGVDTFFYVYSIKSLRDPIYSYNVFSNPLLVIATAIGFVMMVVAIYVPALNTLLGTVPLAPIAWAVIIGKAIINIVGIELAKWFFVRRKGHA